MSRDLVFNYRKSYGFLCFGLLSVFAASVLAVPMLTCPCAWNLRWVLHWWYLYLIPMGSAAAFLAFGVSSLLFWFNHIRKKPYLVITDDMIYIDAETDIKTADIAGFAIKRFLGCEMLCLEIKNPRDYKFSWRFRADRLFHKNHHAFICPELVDKKREVEDWFAAHYPRNDG